MAVSYSLRSFIDHFKTSQDWRKRTTYLVQGRVQVLDPDLVALLAVDLPN